tara:strand:+ start:312 stop:458 length:147 start_codon:yes stop_codon:yes gene_type:complete
MFCQNVVTFFVLSKKKKEEKEKEKSLHKVNLGYQKKEERNFLPPFVSP